MASSKTTKADKTSPAKAPRRTTLTEIELLRSEVGELRLMLRDFLSQSAAPQIEIFEAPLDVEIPPADEPIVVEEVPHEKAERSKCMEFEILRSELQEAIKQKPVSDWNSEESEEFHDQSEWASDESNVDKELADAIALFNSPAVEEDIPVPMIDIEADLPKEDFPGEAEAEVVVEDTQELVSADPQVGVAMDEDEIAALIAEAEALAKAEIEANQEQEDPDAFENLEESKPAEDAEFKTTGFLATSPENENVDTSALVSPSAEQLATIPRDLAVAALACPRVDADGQLWFLVASPVDEQNLTVLAEALGGDINTIPQPLEAVLASFRETYPSGTAKSGGSIFKKLFKKAS